MLIVTGTGRCGTKTVAQLLNIHHEYNCGELISPWFRDAGNTACPWEDKEAVLRHHLRDAGDLAQFGDASNLYVHFIDELRAIDPDVCVIHLVRNPFGFIESAMGRGWHSRNIFGMAPAPDDEWADLWQYADEVKRCAWIWQHRVNLAERASMVLKPGHVARIRIEKLFQPDVLDFLREFTGRVLDEKMIEAKTALNTDQRDPFAWKRSEVEAVWFMASGEMEELGYDAKGAAVWNGPAKG